MGRYEQLHEDHEARLARMTGRTGPAPDSVRPAAPGPVQRGWRNVALVASVMVALVIGGGLIWGRHKGDVALEESGIVGSGTGFFISPDGVFLTAAHVVEGGGEIAIRGDGVAWAAKVLRLDTANDLAVLRVAVDRDVPSLSLGESSQVKMGDGVFTVGFPNIALQGASPKLTRGDVSSVTGIQDDPRIFQISVPVQPGNSGGPLADLGGHVIGVVVARLDDRAAVAASGSLPQNVNYAVKSAYVRSLLETVPDATRRAPLASEAAVSFEPAVERVRSAVALVLVRRG